LNISLVSLDLVPSDFHVFGPLRKPPWWQTFRWWRGWNGGAEVTETTLKRLLCCGFRNTGKAIGQVYQCWWRICWAMNVFSRFKYHTFYVLHPFVTDLLTLPRIADRRKLITMRLGWLVPNGRTFENR
jgi:hypothetical protein